MALGRQTWIGPLGIKPTVVGEIADGLALLVVGIAYIPSASLPKAAGAMPYNLMLERTRRKFSSRTWRSALPLARPQTLAPLLGGTAATAYINYWTLRLTNRG